jgi:hypothetical protein
MKSNRAAKHIAPTDAATAQLVLDAYLTSTKDRAFRAFVKGMLQPKPRRRPASIWPG